MFRVFGLILVLIACGLALRAQESHNKPVQIRVQSGETLESIAAQYQIPVDQLADHNHLRTTTRLRRGQRLVNPPKPSSEPATDPAEIIDSRIKFADGRTLEVDEAWRQGQTVWFRPGGMTQSLDAEVKNIEPILPSKQPPA